MSALMLSVALALSSAPPHVPRAGHYYRQAFAASVQAGTFDPEPYAKLREPSVKWSFPTAIIDSGDTRTELLLRYVATGTVVRLETRGPAAAKWSARDHVAESKSRLRTDLLGSGPETLVRLGHDFETLCRLARDRNQAALRHRLNGLYRTVDGEELVVDAKAIVRPCAESCRAPATCLEISGARYRLEGEKVLIEVDLPPESCRDGRRFERAQARPWP